jgi:hypothetical protein
MPFLDNWKQRITEEGHTKKTGPWIVVIQSPAPGGSDKSAHAATETISPTSTFMSLLSLSSDLLEGLSLSDQLS